MQLRLLLTENNLKRDFPTINESYENREIEKKLEKKNNLTACNEKNKKMTIEKRFFYFPQIHINQ
jgi:hypothetical protein